MEDITLNNQPGAIFKDKGDGDVDFYTFWYSVCYNIAMLSNFREMFANVEGYEVMPRRFLESRGVTFTSDATPRELLYLYRHWLEELKKRGTKEIHRFVKTSIEVGETGYDITRDPELDINANKGLAIHGSNLQVTLKNDVYIDFHFILSADILIGATNGTLFATANSDNELTVVIANDTLTVGLKGSAVQLFSCNFSVAEDAGKIRNIKIAATNSTYRVYYENELKGTYTAAQVEDYFFDTLITGAFSGITYLASVILSPTSLEKGWLLEWEFNKGAGFFVPCKSNNILYHGYIQAIDGVAWADLWLRTESISNTNYSGINGELLRLINYMSGEFTHALINSAELGLTIGMSSFLSEEASAVNMNKFNHLLESMKFSDTVRPVLNSDGSVTYQLLAADSAEYWGVNANILDVLSWRDNPAFKPQGHIPFLPIPVATQSDDFKGYEVSFFIEATGSLNMKFGIYPMDKDLNYIPRSNTLVKYGEIVSTHLFSDFADFRLAANRKIWIRAIYTPSGQLGVSDTMNIGVGSNLMGWDNIIPVENILPYILFKSNNNQNVNVTISEVVVRPLELNTAKGILGAGNNMFGIMRNASGKADEEILERIERDFIPANCNTNIKFI